MKFTFNICKKLNSIVWLFGIWERFLKQGLRLHSNKRVRNWKLNKISIWKFELFLDPVWISVKYLDPSLTRPTAPLTTYHEGAGSSPSCPATDDDDTKTNWGPEMSVWQGQQEVKISQGDRASHIWSWGRENWGQWIPLACGCGTQ